MALAVLQPDEIKPTTTNATVEPNGGKRKSGEVEAPPDPKSRGTKYSQSEPVPSAEPGPTPIAIPSNKIEVDSQPKLSSRVDDNVKAVKNDDSKANVSEWNIRAGRKLPGGYELEKHDQSFDALRQASLRWYQNKVRKSFTNYLRVTYGPVRWNLGSSVEMKMVGSLALNK